MWLFARLFACSLSCSYVFCLYLPHCSIQFGFRPDHKYSISIVCRRFFYLGKQEELSSALFCPSFTDFSQISVLYLVCSTDLFSCLYFQSTLPDDVFENGGCGVAECKRLSFTFSDTSGSTPSPSPALSSYSPGQSNPEITVTPPETEPLPTQIFPTREDSIAEEHLVEEEEEEEYEEDGETGSRGSRGSRNSASIASDEAEAAEDSEWERTESQRNSSSNCGSAAPSLCSDGQLSAVAPEDVFLDHADELKPVELDTEEAGSLTKQLVKRLTSSEMMPPSGSDAEGEGSLSWAGEGSRAFLESSLEEAIHSLLTRLESLTHRCRELQDLEQEVMRLEDLLKVNSISLTSTEPLVH